MITLIPPNSNEPEISIFPDPEKCDGHKLLKSFPEHIEKILKKPQKEERRSFREYCITFSLECYDNNNTPYNFRMRAFLHPMPDGSITSSNWQFTVKTRGNGMDRQEFETRDDLQSANIQDAFTALKRKYGAELPQEISNINPNQFFVNGVCINSRIGQNGVHNSGNTLVPEYNALAMYNSDFVLFTTPDILDDKGQLINLGPRLEMEVELKSISIQQETIDKLTKLYPSQDGALASLFGASLLNIAHHASAITPHVVKYDTGKVDEAILRASPHLETIKYDWSTASERKGRVPEDYLKPERQNALRALIEAVPSPYKKPNKEQHKRSEMFAKMRQNGEREAKNGGYHVALLAAA